MTQRFTIHDRLPGINEYTSQQRANKYGGNLMKKHAQKAVEWEIRTAKIKPVKAPVTILYTFYEPNKRRDKDNIAGFAHKVIQDALVACGIIKDDAWDYIVGFEDRFGIDKKNPHIDVVIKDEKDDKSTDHSRGADG